MCLCTIDETYACMVDTWSCHFFQSLSCISHIYRKKRSKHVINQNKFEFFFLIRLSIEISKKILKHQFCAKSQQIAFIIWKISIIFINPIFQWVNWAFKNYIFLNYLIICSFVFFLLLQINKKLTNILMTN